MSPTLQRTNFKSFWDKYSGKADNTAMMLNHNADDIEAADRADVLGSLPDIKGKDAVDVGAGIGRFTTVLAETARYVLSTDFIDSFIKKNQERNSHLGNVDYQVGDAVHLKMDKNSVDMVFTNWLMMYMSDREVVEFLVNAIEWLRPDGYMHLRESCSEPSTGRAVSNTLHTADANPTSYRFSSLYINIIRAIRHRDETGKLWKLRLNWSCSVPTYIRRMNNWRQVHWLMQKVEADNEDKEQTFDELLEQFSNTWNEEQKMWDAKLDKEEFVWTEQLIHRALPASKLDRTSTLFAYTPRNSSPFLHINSHAMAEKFGVNVWNVEQHPYYYRTSLTKANTLKDQRVRFAWHETLDSSIDYWHAKKAVFDAFVGTEVLATARDGEVKRIPSILVEDAPVVLLEPVKDFDEPELIKKLEMFGFNSVKMEDVTDDAERLITEYHTAHDLPAEPKAVGIKWILINCRS